MVKTISLIVMLALLGVICYSVVKWPMQVIAGSCVAVTILLFVGVAAIVPDKR